MEQIAHRRQQEIIYGLLDVASNLIDNAVNLANERNSIDEAEFFADMDYEEILAFRVNNAVNPLCRNAFDKYINEIFVVDTDYNNGGRYNSFFNEIYLSVENDSVGKRIEKDGRMETSKKDKYNHGFGLENVRECVKRNEGELLIENGQNTFKVFVVLHNEEELERKVEHKVNEDCSCG